jgi:hypothetical protein
MAPGESSGAWLTGLVAGAALVLSLGVTGWETGYAVRYAKNRMERTADIRALPQQPCMVAWTQATDADIGTTWLRVVGPAGSATCAVIDLPETVDRPALEARGIVVELGWKNRNLCRPGWSGRARDCRVRVQVIRGKP